MMQDHESENGIMNTRGGRTVRVKSQVDDLRDTSFFSASSGFDVSDFGSDVPVLQIEGGRDDSPEISESVLDANEDWVMLENGLRPVDIAEVKNISEEEVKTFIALQEQERDDRELEFVQNPLLRNAEKHRTQILTMILGCASFKFISRVLNVSMKEFLEFCRLEKIDLVFDDEEKKGDDVAEITAAISAGMDLESIANGKGMSMGGLWNFMLDNQIAEKSQDKDTEKRDLMLSNMLFLDERKNVEHIEILLESRIELKHIVQGRNCTLEELLDFISYQNIRFPKDYHHGLENQVNYIPQRMKKMLRDWKGKDCFETSGLVGQMWRSDGVSGCSMDVSEEFEGREYFSFDFQLLKKKEEEEKMKKEEVEMKMKGVPREKDSVSVKRNPGIVLSWRDFDEMWKEWESKGNDD